MQTLMSQTDFARHMSTPTKNVTQQMISKYIRQGKLPVQGNKLIMPDAEKAYHLIMGGISIRVMENQEGNLPVNNLDLQNLTEAKTEYQAYMAKIKKLEFEKMQGNLVSVDEVIKEVETVATVMRTELFSIPAKVAPECEGKSISQIELIIHNAINEAFTILNDFDYYQFGSKPQES